jgi:two-component system response regulator QseB
MRILLVEDDALLGKAVRIGLEQLDYQVDWIQRGEEALSYLRLYSYDALLLDLGLPDLDGLEVLRLIRQQRRDVPVLILTARDQIRNRIEGLDLGADDFMVKPVDLDEMAARLRAITRRRAGRSAELLEHGQLCIDLSAQKVTLNGSPVSLTGRELSILRILLDRRGQVISRQQIEDGLYSWQDEIGSNTIEVHIHHLRRKLGKQLIRTVHHQGYTIDPPARVTDARHELC